MLRGSLALIFLLCTSCLQTENDSNWDDRPLSGTPAFMAANAVLVSKCTGCHDYHTMTEDELREPNSCVGAVCVNAGNAAGSKLYFRTKCAAGPIANMPITADTLSTDECDKLRNWINGITP